MARKSTPAPLWREQGTYTSAPDMRSADEAAATIAIASISSPLTVSEPQLSVNGTSDRVINAAESMNANFIAASLASGVSSAGMFTDSDKQQVEIAVAGGGYHG